MSTSAMVEQIIRNLEVAADLPSASVADRYYRASKLRAVRTELSALIKADEASK